MTTMLYKSPGPHNINGDMVDHKVVENDKIEKALDDGWFRTIPEAVEASESESEVGALDPKESTITEQIPEDMPEWAKESMGRGTLFKDVFTRIADLEEELVKVKALVPESEEVETVAMNVLLDADGLPWDERIHVAAKTRTHSDKWRVKPGISKEVLAKVRTGLT